VTATNVPTAEDGALDFDCDQALPKLYAFIDNELTPDELRAMQQHLEGCDSCTYEYDVRVKLKGVIHDSCIDAAPVAVKQRIAARIATARAAAEADPR
jgi:mycothiol system anti-sigma-R factor